jgi:hypothetical protein
MVEISMKAAGTSGSLPIIASAHSMTTSPRMSPRSSAAR